MLHKVFLRDGGELRAFLSVSKVLLFLLIQAILLFLLEVFATFLLRQLVHGVSHDLIVVVVGIGRDVPGVLITKFEVSLFEIGLCWHWNILSFFIILRREPTWGEGVFGGCVLGIKFILSATNMKVGLSGQRNHLLPLIYACILRAVAL